MQRRRPRRGDWVCSIATISVARRWMRASAISAEPAGLAHSLRRKRTVGKPPPCRKIVQLNAQLDVPFSLLNQRFSFNTQYLRQMSNTPLTPQDQFAIGNRWSVRGFDGQRTLNADEGWYIRNDIGWPRRCRRRNSIWRWIMAKSADAIAGRII